MSQLSDLSGGLLAPSECGGSSVGPSASVAGLDVSSLVAALVPALVPAVKAAIVPEGGGGGKAKQLESGSRRCPNCRRPHCPMLDDSSKLCRAASDALKLLKAQAGADGKTESES